MPSNFKWQLGLVLPIQDPSPFSPFSPIKWADAVCEIKRYGFDGVEIAVTDPSTIDYTKIQRALSIYKLKCFAIATGQAAQKYRLSLASRDNKTREQAMEFMKRFIDLANALDAVVIVGWIRGYEGDINLLIESLRECALYNTNVRIVLEAINRYETTLINTTRDAMSIVEKVGCDNLGIHLDTFHMNIEEKTFKEAFLIAKRKLFHVDIADSNRWILGYGHIPWGEVWHALETIEYEGHLIFECYPLPSKRELLLSARRLRED